MVGQVPYRCSPSGGLTWNNCRWADYVTAPLANTGRARIGRIGRPWAAAHAGEVARDRKRVIIGDIAAISRLAKLERESVGRRAADRQLSDMDCLVVEIAYCDDISQIVAAAVASVFNVVQIEPDVPPASGHRAAITVSREHLRSLASGDGRRGSLRHRGIERAEVNGIARGTLGHRWFDLDVPAAAVLPCALAIGALLDRDLVGG
jgi:hypothetical protein